MVDIRNHCAPMEINALTVAQTMTLSWELVLQMRPACVSTIMKRVCGMAGHKLVCVLKIEAMASPM